jgi:CubicO group peptidase (beta-lactamase class C family)
MIERFEKLQRIIVKLMRKFKVPGLALSILKDGDIIYKKGYGARDLEENLPMTPDTLIGIGSVSKSFTALLIYKLQENGLLNTNDSVSKFLDIEPFLSNPDIKIKHLLSHSSGIPSVDGQWLPIAITYGDYERIYPITSHDDYLYHLSETKNEIFFKPGEKFFYNNDMFTLLSIIIENLTGQSFETVLKENILNPLKMDRTVITRKGLEDDPIKDYITGYIHKVKTEGTEKKTTFDKPKLPFSNYLQAPGGIYSSMHEMMNYAQCLLQEGFFNGNQIIEKESVKKLFEPLVDSPYGHGKNPKYCSGWVREEDFYDHIYIHHSGGLGVSTSFFGIIPELNIAVSVAENDDAGICALIGVCALEILLGKDPEIVNKDLRLINIFEQIKGKYKSSLGLYGLEVLMKDGSIHIKVDSDDGTFSFPLIVDDLDNLIFKLFSSIPSELQKVQFFKENSSTRIKFVTYDRYLYHKL